MNTNKVRMFADPASVIIFLVLSSPFIYFGIRYLLKGEGSSGLLMLLFALIFTLIPALNFISYDDHELVHLSLGGRKTFNLRHLVGYRVAAASPEAEARGEIQALELTFKDGSGQVIMTKPFKRSDLVQLHLFLEKRKLAATQPS